jgi:hypothetical protein
MTVALMMTMMVSLGIMTLAAGPWLRRSVEREHQAFQRELDTIMSVQPALAKASNRPEENKINGGTHVVG